VSGISHERTRGSPDINSRGNKIRNMFVLRKGNSTKDSDNLRKSSNENLNSNVYMYSTNSNMNCDNSKDNSGSSKIYGMDRQSSINSLVESDSCYTRDNSLGSQFARNQKHSSSNGFENHTVFDPYSQGGSSFKTPRQKQNIQLASINKKIKGSNEGKNINIANRNIKIRAIASTKINWKMKSNGFKEIYEKNFKNNNVSDNSSNFLLKLILHRKLL